MVDFNKALLTGILKNPNRTIKQDKFNILISVLNRMNIKYHMKAYSSNFGYFSITRKSITFVYDHDSYLFVEDYSNEDEKMILSINK